MWIAILGIAGEVIKFLCKLGVNWLDNNQARKKKRDEIYKNDVQTAGTQRDMFLAITRFNRVR